MPRLAITEAREHLAHILNEVHYRGERVLVERRGKPLAAIVPPADLELLEALEDRLDALEGLRALAEAEASGEPNVPLEELLKEFGIED